MRSHCHRNFWNTNEETQFMNTQIQITVREAVIDLMRRFGITKMLAEVRDPSHIVVEEAPSSRRTMQSYLPFTEPNTFITMASGGLGYGIPAAVGVALASPGKKVIGLIGDGSSMYSIQSLWTARAA
jgi:benzoylformate decarboxylase